MTNPRGTRWASAVVGWLNENGFPYAERRAQAGSKDRGDISGIPGVMMELKDEAKITLAAYMDEVRTEKFNAAAGVACAVVKRRGKGIGRAYVVMELEDFVELIR